MADHDRFRGHAANDRGVMCDDVVDPDVRDTLGMRIRFGHRGAVTGPSRRDGIVARGAEQLDPWFPGIGVKPEAVDEDDRRGHRRSLKGELPLMCGSMVLLPLKLKKLVNRTHRNRVAAR